MMHASRVRGVSVPAFFYGTAWKEERTEALTAQALRCGFRAIDTANQRKHYLEAGVGAAVAAEIAAGRVRREDLFLQTKFTYARGQDERLPYDPGADVATQVAQSFASSLQHLRTSYVDSLLLHGPENAEGLTDGDASVWRAMEALHAQGRVHLLGISNVSLGQLVELTRAARIAPAFVQNRCYARTGWDREVRSFCRANGILYQGFSLLTANARELRHPTVERIAASTGRTVAQLVFRFAIDVGMVPLTGSSREDHLRQDLAVAEFELDAKDRAALEWVALA